MKALLLVLLLFFPMAAHADFVGAVAHALASGMKGEDIDADHDDSGNDDD